MSIVIIVNQTCRFIQINHQTLILWLSSTSWHQFTFTLHKVTKYRHKLIHSLIHTYNTNVKERQHGVIVSLTFNFLTSLRILLAINICMSTCCMINHWLKKHEWNFTALHDRKHVHDRLLFCMDNISQNFIFTDEAGAREVIRFAEIQGDLSKGRGDRAFWKFGGKGPKGVLKDSRGLEPWMKLWFYRASQSKYWHIHCLFRN